MATVDSLEIEICASVQRAMTSLNALTRQLNTVGAGLNRIGTSSGSGFSRLNTAARRANDGFSRLSLNVNKTNYSIKKITNNSNSFSGSLKNLTKGLVSVAALMRGFKALGESIKEATGYIEDYNFYTVSFGKIASEWGNDFEKYGYSNAQEYSDSFVKRMNATLGKLSGVKIELDAEGKGLLSESGMKNLGLNIRETTQYAAQLASVTNSLGMTGEASLAASKAMTALAGDISSLFNTSYKSAAQNLQSGLIGQSRALYKYGIDITNATLQTYAYKLGLEKAVSEMTQAEKMQLRLIAILDQSKVAWGDLANTINSPANMIRQMSNNFKELSMIIGQMFIPILQKILPVINGVLIAAKRLAVFIAGLIGIKLDFSAFGQGYSDMTDGLGDVTDGYDDATKSAKKFNKQLRAFDELNTISLKNDSGSGSGGAGGGIDLTDDILKAAAEYEKAWQEAFDKMENDAEKIADKIQKVLKDVWEPIGKAWAAEGKYVQRAWTEALKNIGSLAVTVGKDIMKVWQQDATVDIFKDIFHIIGDIGQVVANLAENFEKAWKKNETGLHILEGIRDIFGIIVKAVREMSEATVYWSATLDFTPILSKINEYIQSLKPVMESLSGIVSDFYTQVLLPLGKWTIEKGIPDLLQVFIDFNNKVDWEGLRSNLSELWKHLEPFAETVGAGIIQFVREFSDVIANFVNSDTFVNLLDKFEGWLDRIDVDDVSDALWGLAAAFVGVKVAVAGFSVLSGVVTVFGVLSSAVTGISSAVGIFANLMTTVTAPIVEMFALWAGGAGTLSESFMAVFGISGALVGVLAALAAGLGITYANNEEVRTSFDNATSAIKDGLQPAIEFMTGTLLPDLSNGWSKIKDVLKPLADFVSGVFVSIWQDMLNPALTYIGNTVLPKLTETFENLWNKVLVPLGSFLSDVLSPVIQIVSDALTILWQNVVVPLAECIGGSLAVAFEGFCDILNETVIPIVNIVIETFQFLWDGVLSPLITELWDNLKPAFEDVFGAIGGIIKGLQQTFSGLIDFITGVFTGDWEQAWNGVKDIFKGVFNGVISILEGAVNFVIDGLNSFLQNFNGVVTDIGSVIGIDIQIPTISKISLPRLATGAIVYEATIAEIGEAGKEAVIPLTNKFAMKTLASEIIASANLTPAPYPDIYTPYYQRPSTFSDGTAMNNEQITQGIAQAVYPAVYNAVSSALNNNRGSGSEPIIKVIVGDRELTDIVVDGINERYMTGGNPLLI